MQNLQITAFLSSPIAVYDNWTPQLEGVIIYQILSELGLNSPNPNINQVNETKQILQEKMPIKKDETYDFYYCSSPVYEYQNESQSRYRKRWTPDQDGQINWGKRKAKFETSQGAEKSYDLPLFLRLTSRIDWFAVGSKNELQEIASTITNLGKKRSQGFGQVHKWEVQEIDNDWSIVRNSELMKPLPNFVYKNLGISGMYNLVNYGWRPPVWLQENKSLCFMPNMVKQNG